MNPVSVMIWPALNTEQRWLVIKQEEHGSALVIHTVLHWHLSFVVDLFYSDSGNLKAKVNVTDSVLNHEMWSTAVKAVNKIRTLWKRASALFMLSERKKNLTIRPLCRINVHLSPCTKIYFKTQNQPSIRLLCTINVHLSRCTKIDFKTQNQPSIRLPHHKDIKLPSQISFTTLLIVTTGL